MSTWYRLDANRNVKPVDMFTGARALEDRESRKVAFTKLADCEVSTVFLGLDHRFGGDGPPIVFETMVFGGPFDGEQDRYATWAAAEAGHQQMVQRVRPGVWRRLRAWWQKS